MNCNSFVGDNPDNVLKSVFGYSAFRPFQKEIIKSVLAKKDTLAIMPTGGGKSLCYQIPALIFDGITIVVSPLIALMQDQVSALVSNGVNAVFLNSTLDWQEYCKTTDDILRGKIKLVYVSPEGLASKRMQDLFTSESVKVSCITIDEAHCVSEWGHDFRPDYLSLSSIRKQFSNAVCLALTATATSKVRNDIVKNICMITPSVFIASFNRENIFLEVQQKRNGFAQVVNFIKAHNDESGIIYCFSRKDVDFLTKELSRLNFSVLNYHAGLSDEDRYSHQKDFIRDKVSIMVATVAFGMGIDKPNIRFVIHYNIPKSLEQYYQEIGRAGRDGLPSHSLLLYSASDIHKIKYFFEESADVRNSEKLLSNMVSFATTRMCRREVLLSYFGERLENNNKENCCDICLNGKSPLLDVTIPAQKLLSCIIRTGEKYGTSYVVDVLLGSKNKRILDNNHNNISTWGIGKELSKSDWFEIASSLVSEGFLFKSEDYSVLSLSPKARTILKTREKIELPVTIEEYKIDNDFESKSNKAKPNFIIHKAPKSIDTSDSESCRIADELRAWRKKLAEEENVPPYVIFGDKTLFDIATKKPDTFSKLNEVYGIGSVKAERFGDAILRIVKNLT